MIPGLIATILILSMTSIMTQAVVRERERGTLEQMFVTPISRGEYLVGKLTPYVLIGVVQMSIVALVGRLWFRVPFNGQLWVVVLGLFLFMLTTVALGLFISLVSHTRQQAQQTVMFIMLPFIMLSGFIFPVASMPPVFQVISYVIPLRYAIEILRGTFIEGAGREAAHLAAARDGHLLGGAPGLRGVQLPQTTERLGGGRRDGPHDRIPSPTSSATR